VLSDVWGNYDNGNRVDSVTLNGEKIIDDIGSNLSKRKHQVVARYQTLFSLSTNTRSPTPDFKQSECAEGASSDGEIEMERASDSDSNGPVEKKREIENNERTNGPKLLVRSKSKNARMYRCQKSRNTKPRR
jgi:hypothetical protein